MQPQSKEDKSGPTAPQKPEARALLSQARTLAIAGALLFAVSDSVLAFNKFRPDVLLYVTPWGLGWVNVTIMSTYYAGQMLLCLSGEWCEMGMGVEAETGGGGGGSPSVTGSGSKDKKGRGKGGHAKKYQ